MKVKTSKKHCFGITLVLKNKRTLNGHIILRDKFYYTLYDELGHNQVPIENVLFIRFDKKDDE